MSTQPAQALLDAQPQSYLPTAERRLADGSVAQFASTARTATFLYSVAVQQLQATEFVTANYNLDMQWLGAIGPPLLVEAQHWSGRRRRPLLGKSFHASHLS